MAAPPLSSGRASPVAAHAFMGAQQLLRRGGSPSPTAASRSMRRAKAVRITVRLPAGGTVAVEVPAGATVRELQRAAHAAGAGVAPWRQQISYAGEVLPATAALAAAGVATDSEVEMVEIPLARCAVGTYSADDRSSWSRAAGGVVYNEDVVCRARVVLETNLSDTQEFGRVTVSAQMSAKPDAAGSASGAEARAKSAEGRAYYHVEQDDTLRFKRWDGERAAVSSARFNAAGSLVIVVPGFPAGGVLRLDRG